MRLPPPLCLIQVEWVKGAIVVLQIDRLPTGEAKAFRVLCSLANPWWPIQAADNDNQK